MKLLLLFEDKKAPMQELLRVPKLDGLVVLDIGRVCPNHDNLQLAVEIVAEL